MDEKDIAALQNAEIDYEDIIDRFEGNESLYLKLAELFLDDPHMPNVRRAFAAGDLATAEVEVHALKGVAGNLSLTSVHKLAKKHERRAQRRRRSHSSQAAPRAGRGVREGSRCLARGFGEVERKPTREAPTLAQQVRRRISRQGAKTRAQSANATPNNKAGRIAAKAIRPAFV